MLHVPGHSLTPGLIYFQSQADTTLELLCDLGDHEPTQTAGFQAINDVIIPGSTPLTRFAGWAAEVWEIELRFDNFDENKSVERFIDDLRAMAGRGSRDPKANPQVTGIGPPQMIIDTGGLWRADYTRFPTVRWKINDVQAAPDSEVTNDHGHTVRADYTIQVKQFTDAPLLAQAAAAAKRVTSSNANTGAARKTYVTHSGDTLLTIARKKLGDASRYLQIAALNPKWRDPHRKIPSGTTIRLP